MKSNLIKTTFASPRFSIMGGCLSVVNTTADGLCCTLNTRYEEIGINHILSLAHFPRTVVLIDYEL